MQQVKRISSTLALHAAVEGDPTTLVIGQVIPNNAQVTINGNLVVNGTTTTVNSTEVSIEDAVITLNSAILNTETPTSLFQSGIEVARGTEANVSILWSEINQKWMLTNDGVNFYNISTQLGSSYLSAVVEDLSPQLGGNLNVDTFTITSPTTVKIEAPIELTEVTVAPLVESGKAIVYAAETTGGGTGVYVASGASTNEELVSKKKAIIYSLIF